MIDPARYYPGNGAAKKHTRHFWTNGEIALALYLGRMTGPAQRGGSFGGSGVGFSPPKGNFQPPNVNVQPPRIFAVGEIGADSPVALKALVVAVSDREVENRRRALQAIGAHGPKAHDLEPDIRAALQDRSSAVREATREALAKTAARMDAEAKTQ